MARKKASAPTPNYDKCIIQFTPLAYCKMKALVKRCAVEVAWHGLVNKMEENKFEITDILCFPQYVSGGFTTTDDNEYWKWAFTLPADMPVFCHGHSHVNFPAFRSGRDEKYQGAQIDAMNDQSFFIFLIVNKKGDIDVRAVNKKIDHIWESVRGEVHLEVTGVEDFIDSCVPLIKPASEYPGEMNPEAPEFTNVSPQVKSNKVPPDSGSEVCKDSDDDWIHLEEFSLADPFARNDL